MHFNQRQRYNNFGKNLLFCKILLILFPHLCYHVLLPTRNTLPVLPRHTRRQVLSSSQRAAVGRPAQPFPTLHVGLLKFAPSGSMSMMSHRQQASNKEIPSIWRLTEWWCREYTPWGKMGGGGDCNKLGARSPAAHLPLFIVFHPLHHSVADDRRQRNLHGPHHLN